MSAHQPPSTIRHRQPIVRIATCMCAAARPAGWAMLLLSGKGSVCFRRPAPNHMSSCWEHFVCHAGKHQANVAVAVQL